MDDALSIWREQTRSNRTRPVCDQKPRITSMQQRQSWDTQQMCRRLYIERHGFVDFPACQLDGASTPQQAKCAMCGTLGRGSFTSFTKLCPHIYLRCLPPTGLGIQSNIGVAGFVERCSHMARRTPLSLSLPFTPTTTHSFPPGEMFGSETPAVPSVVAASSPGWGEGTGRGWVLQGMYCLARLREEKTFVGRWSEHTRWLDGMCF